MRTFTLDQYEFESFESEESLRVAVATKSSIEFKNVKAFLDSARKALCIYASSEPGNAVPFRTCKNAEMLRRYFEDFGKFGVAVDCEWPTFVLADDWWETELLMDGPDAFCSSGGKRPRDQFR